MQNPIECLIMKDGKPLTYDEDKKILFIAAKGFTVFSSKHKAHSALHHAVETDRAAGIEKPWLQYEVVET